MITCRVCNRELEADSAFCRFCGCAIKGFSEREILPTLFTEVTEELRSRRQAEFVYTAAAIGSFGAIAWGVAALGPGRSIHSPCVMLHPAIVASIGAVAVALVVSVKIWSEHKRYRGGMKQLGKYSERISQVFNVTLSEKLLSGEAGPGYRGSIWIVIVAALMAVTFCLSVWTAGGSH